MTTFKAGFPNFPADQEELDKRLKDIEKLINNDDDVSTVNIKFVEAAFQLMQDCNLITESNIKFLLDPHACRNFKPIDPCDRAFKSDFYFMRNPSEGALRCVNDYNDVNANGKQRFYSGLDRRVELNGENFLVSNDWYNDYSGYPNKRAFYLWLKEKAQVACEKHWDDNSKSITPNNDDNSIVTDSKEPEDLKAMIALLKDLHKKIDDINEKVTFLYSELK